MSTLLDDPRVAALVHEAASARDLLASMLRRGSPSSEIEEALDGIYRDLGKLVVKLAQNIDPDSTISDISPLQPSARADSGLEVVDDYIEEDDIDPVTLEISVNAHLDVSDTYGDELDAYVADEPMLPEPTDTIEIPKTPPGFAPTDFGPAPARATASARFYEPSDTLEEAMGGEATGSTEILRPSIEDLGPDMSLETRLAPAHSVPDPWSHGDMGSTDVWIAQLHDLMDLLSQPTPIATAAQLAIESAKVQWATSQLLERWHHFPDPIRLALLGMLSARCRHLQEQMSLDVGPRQALSRLRHYRRTTGLSSVVGLVPNRKPEYNTWVEDAAHWWGALSSGLNV